MLDALVMSKITSLIPSTQINPAQAHHLEGLKLADPFYFKPEAVDLLIGVDLFACILRPSPVIKGPPGFPDAVDTM
ncbi:unnamed protein product, partial [Allacma fusca]